MGEELEEKLAAAKEILPMAEFFALESILVDSIDAALEQVVGES